MTREGALGRRARRLALTGRFTDEVGSGTFDVLGPTFIRVFGIDVVGLALLNQILFWVALIVEPVTSLLIDVRSRRVLLVWGSTAVAAALLSMGTAAGYSALLLGFVLYGMGSGPLAHTADVLLVEGSDEAERTFTKATVLDTLGALIAPALVAGAAALELSWRIPLVVAAAVAGVYAGTAALTPFAAPPVAPGRRILAEVRGNLGAVAASAPARRWLAFALVFELIEAERVLRYVWLSDVVGLGQAGAALYAVGEHVVGLLALIVLERRQRAGSVHLPAVCAAMGVLYAGWLLAPGAVGKVAVGVPLAAVTAWIWPVSRARTLQSVPGRAGAVSALTTLTGLVPGALIVGLLAGVLGLTAAFAMVVLPATLVLVLLAGAPSAPTAPGAAT